MKAYIIDPKRQIISSYVFKGDYTEIQKAIAEEGENAPYFDVVRLNSKNDTAYVDDMGYYKENYFWSWEGYANPLAGKALVLGTTSSGNNTDVKLSITELTDKISFHGKAGPLL